MKKLLLLVGLAASVAVPLARAEFAKPADAIEYRQSAMTLIGEHTKRIGAVVKGARPYDPAQVQASAEVIEFVSKLPWEAFGPGTDEGHHTHAKPEIWKDPAKFKQASEKMQAAATKLSAAAKTGKLDEVKTAFGALGQSCKGCHDDFRARD